MTGPKMTGTERGRGLSGPFLFLFIFAIGLARDLRVDSSGLHAEPREYNCLENDPDGNHRYSNQNIAQGYFPLPSAVSAEAFAALPFGFLILS